MGNLISSEVGCVSLPLCVLTAERLGDPTGSSLMTRAVNSIPKGELAPFCCIDGALTSAAVFDCPNCSKPVPPIWSPKLSTAGLPPGRGVGCLVAPSTKDCGVRKAFIYALSVASCPKESVDCQGFILNCRLLSRSTLLLTRKELLLVSQSRVELANRDIQKG
jgi:hypothetical protein